jgi:hypothetical protein
LWCSCFFFNYFFQFLILIHPDVKRYRHPCMYRYDLWVSCSTYNCKQLQLQTYSNDKHINLSSGDQQ